MEYLLAVLIFLGCAADAQVLAPPVSFDVAVSDFGAVPNDGLDDTPGIQAAIDQAQANGGGRVVLIAGQYDLGSVTSQWGIFDLEDYSGISIVGEGSGATVLRHIDGKPLNGGGQTRIFWLQHSSHIAFSDFTIDGNRSNVSYNAQEQDHGIYVAVSDNIRIEGMEIVRTGGDGVYLLGNSVGVTWTQDVWITNSKFLDNRRNGITVQRDVRRVVISGNVFENVNSSAIDFEPTGCAQGVEDVLISDNILNDGVLTVGGCPGFPARRIVVTGNVLNEWAQFLITEDSQFSGNVVVNGAPGPAVSIRGQNDNLIVSDNTIRQLTPSHAVYIFSVNVPLRGLPENVTVRGNTIVQDAGASGHFGIYLLNVGKDVRISGNNIQGNGLATDGIRARQHNVSFVPEGLVIDGNQIRNFGKRGVLIFATTGAAIRHFRIANNFIDDVPTGIEQIGGTGTVELGDIFGNTFGPNVTTQVKP